MLLDINNKQLRGHQLKHMEQETLPYMYYYWSYQQQDSTLSNMHLLNMQCDFPARVMHGKGPQPAV